VTTTNTGAGATSPDGVATQPARGVASGRRAQAGWGLPLIVLIIGMFMSVLDTSIVNVAIPAIQNDFGGTTDQVQWVVTGYTLMLGVIVPSTAWLGDRFGLKELYNAALVAFAVGSALCGLAPSLHTLVVFRILQAIPGGILPVVTLSILLRIVPRERLGAAMGLYGLGIVFAPGIGPVLGGYLVEYVNWRLIFYINVPIGIVGAVAAALVLPRFPRVTGRRFDVLGFLTIGGGLFALLLATSEGETWGWSSYRILGLFVYSMLSLALFVVIELEVSDPLLDIRIFRCWPFTNSLLLIAVLMTAMYGVLFYIPQFLQLAQGWGAFPAGLTVLPQAMVMAVLMPITGRVYDRIGPRWPATIGLTLAAAATYLLHTTTLNASREHITWLLMLLGFGLGCAFMPILTGGVAVIPLARTNAASALNNVVQRCSAALGLSMLTAILTIQEAQQYAGRAALVPAPTQLVPATVQPPYDVPFPLPRVGPPGTPAWLSVWSLYNQTLNLAFVGAIDDVFLIAAGLCALGVLGALLLRSGPAPAPPVDSRPLPSAAAPPATAPVTDNSKPAPQTGELLDVGADTHPQDPRPSG
jgi:EmrB/QacA subfamily drug resistance transporter